MRKEEKLQKFYEMVDEIETAMFTTRRVDGLLVSRPMATQKRAAGADLWFVTSRDSDKLTEIRHDSNVNLAYYHPRTKEWISVAGTARIVRDREKVKELWAADWRAWFGDQGGEKDGTPDDPRITLIGIKVRVAMYLQLNKPQPVVLFELVKGMITGKQPNLGKTETLTAKEVSRGRRKVKAPGAR
jgi:general stress protein 26